METGEGLRIIKKNNTTETNNIARNNEQTTKKKKTKDTIATSIATNTQQTETNNTKI